MTEQTNVPKLRFGEFKGKSESLLIQDFAKVTSGGTPNRAIKEYWGGSIPWITTSQINYQDINAAEEFITDEGLKNSSAKLFPKGTLLLALYGQGVTRGRVSILNMEATTNQACAALILNGKKSNNRYMLFNLQARYEELRALSNSGGQKNLSGGLIKSLPVALPTLDEQQKIAYFLSKVDEKISLLTEKKDKLTEYKKGVMQQLFNGKWDEQDGQLNFIPPTLRFKADDGSEFPDWEEKKLGQVFTRIRRKNKENNQNVLTISAQQGLINQEKYFNKSVAAKDVTGYYLLENGDFAYNKSYSKGYPMGAIKRLNNYDKGVVSTLYICFGLNQGFVSDFFEHYFESGLQNRDLSKIAQEGARNHGLLNISVDEFFKDVKLLTPSHDEQLKIANFLSVIDQKIYLANSELEKANEWKKGLLQQMFV